MNTRILPLIILLFQTTATLSAQWVVKHVDKSGPTIHDLQMHPQGLGLAVGDNGLILRSEENGESWLPVPNSISGTINQVAFASADKIVISSHELQSNGALHQSVDGGLTWDSVYSYPDLFLSLQFFNDSVGLASGISTIIRTSDGGATWTEVYNLPAETSFKSGIIWMNIATDSISYAGIQAWKSGPPNLSRFLLKSIDSGKTWVKIIDFDDVISNVDIYFFDELHGFVEQGYHFQRTKDGGMTWDTTDNIGAVSGISMPSQSRVYIINQLIPIDEFPGEFAICHSIDSGLTWEGQFKPGAHMEAIQFLNDTVGFVAGKHSIIMKTEHGGGPIVGDYPWDLYTSLTLEKANPIGIRIHPNPARSMLHLSLDGEIQRWPMILVKIIRPDGKVVFSTPFTTTTANMEIPVSTLPSGFYFLQLTDTKGQILGVEKVIVE